MKIDNLKWPDYDRLKARARARVRELRRMVSFLKFDDADATILQSELDMLATMVKIEKKEAA